MPDLEALDLQQSLRALETAGAERVGKMVDAILRHGIQRGASDIHFETTHRNLELRFRLDGVLQTLATLGRELAPNLIARLKVLAELLTYRGDIPQEGRIADAQARYGAAMRVSTFPTVHGEKAAVRLFDANPQLLDLDQLGLDQATKETLQTLLRQRQGAILLTGPSGSGKTSTIYACLRQLARDGGRHIVTLEDPVEQCLEGVSQSQARPGTEFDFARGLRSLLRQDPEVIMVGEIRDHETAGIAIEAALTGHLVFSTLHAGSACGVLGRLMEMGVEPYLLTSSLAAILNQRLVRRLCDACSRAGEAMGCPACAGTGYRGRLLLAELLTLDAALRQAILARKDTAALEAIASAGHLATLRDAAQAAIAAGQTTAQEIARVLGPLW